MKVKGWGRDQSIKNVLVLYDDLASHKDPHAFLESQFNYFDGRVVKYLNPFHSDANTYRKLSSVLHIIGQTLKY